MKAQPKQGDRLDNHRHENQSNYPFMDRAELGRINAAFRSGDRWKELWQYLSLPNPRFAKQTRDNDWWCISPFNPSETRASFHMNVHGFYCHSTQENGSFVNLAALLLGVNVYHAAHRIREEVLGLPPMSAATLARSVSRSVHETVSRREKENKAIRMDLRPLLSPTHPEFERRGISARTLELLGAGYLDRPPRQHGRPDPINRRLVFQVRGLQEQEEEDGRMSPVILTHVGRATTAEQEEQHGKWFMYPGFRKSLELYNIDLAILDEEAERQACDTGHVLVVEGPFDVAKLYEAGIRNVVATFGAQLSAPQIRRLDLVSEMTGVDRFRFFYDRDQAGQHGAEKALAAFSGNAMATRQAGYPAWVEGLTSGLEADAFDWEQTWSSSARTAVGIPEGIRDPCDLTVEQLGWLREEGVI